MFCGNIRTLWCGLLGTLYTLEVYLAYIQKVGEETKKVVEIANSELTHFGAVRNANEVQRWSRIKDEVATQSIITSKRLVLSNINTNIPKPTLQFTC